MLDFIKKYREGSAGLGKALRDVRQQIEVKKQRRDDLGTLPILKAEFIAELQASIDTSNEVTREHVQQTVDQLLTRPGKPLYERNYIPLLGSLHGQANNVTQQFVYMLLADTIKDAIPAMVDRIDYPAEVGPPRAEREAEIARLDKEIVKLEVKEQEYLDVAAAAGVNTAPLGKHSSIKV